MAVQNAAILEGATLSATGGTSKTYALTGTKIQNGIQIADSSVSSVTERPFINLSARPSSYDRNNDSWSLEKRNVVSTRPYIDAKLKQQFPSIDTKFNFTADMTQAQREELIKMHAQCLIDADFAAFLHTGTLA